MDQIPIMIIMSTIITIIIMTIAETVEVEEDVVEVFLMNVGTAAATTVSTIKSQLLLDNADAYITSGLKY